MNATPLTAEEREMLLKFARASVTAAVSRMPFPAPEAEQLTPAIRELGASFVTLTCQDELRGCIGTLEAYQPLALDVIEHAAAAASEDYRFSPVQLREVPKLQIEISRLTPPQSLSYSKPGELSGLLRPSIDGVILRDGVRLATFLPQVWEKLPDPAAFLSHLCDKMGIPSDMWRRKLFTVSTYQVEEFHD